MPRIDNISNFGDFKIPSGSFIAPDITASIGKLTASFIDSDTLLVGTIKPLPGQSGVIMEGFNPCCVYVTGSNSVEALRTSSIQPKLTTHDNKGQCSVVNGGNLHNIDTNTQYGGIQSGYSSSLSQQCASNIAGGYQNKIKEGVKGRVPGNSIGGGFNNTIVGANYSTILGGRSNSIDDYCDTFVVGSNIVATASCTAYVNCLNIQDIDASQPSDQLLVRHTASGLVRQGPPITDVSGSGDGLVIEVPGLVNPDRDVYVIADNSDSVIATSSIKPFYMPSNVNEGKNSVISSGEVNRLIQMCSLPPQNSGIFSGQYNAISGSDRSTIEGGNSNDIIMGHHLSASVNYTNYAIDHSIQNGSTNKIINELPSVVKHVSTTGIYESGSCIYVAGTEFNDQIVNSGFYSQAGTGSIIWFEHSTYAGSPINSGPQTSGSQAILTPPIVINNYSNAIQNGINNRILNYAYLNVIDGGSGNLIQSYFFPQRYAIGNPNCAGKTLYFKAAQRNFIGAGAINTIQGASYSGIVAGLRNVIEFDEPGKDNEAKSFIGAGACNVIGMTKMSAIAAGFDNRIKRPGGFNFIGGGRSNRIVESHEAFIGSGCCNLASNYSAVAGGRFNRATGDGTFIGGGVNNCNNNQNGVIVGGFCNTLSNGYSVRTENVVVGGRCNRIHANCQSSILGGFNNFIKTNNSNHSSIVGGINNTVSGSSNSSVLGGRNNTITNLNNTFVIGSDLTAERECTSFVNSFDISGSLDMNLPEVPTSSVGLRTGQVYRTGSAFDELRIKL